MAIPVSLTRTQSAMVALGAAYVAFRIAGFFDAVPRSFPDTGTYERVGEQSLGSIDFRAGWRSPTLPLLYKLIDGEQARIWAQLLISMACWLALAAAVASWIEHRILRVVSFGAVLLFALAPEVVLWDAVLLSESLSLSLAAVLVACWLFIIRRPAPGLYALMVALTAAWALTRDAHSLAVLAVALLLLVAVWRSEDLAGPRRLRLVAVVALIGITVGSALSASVHFARWARPLQDVLSLRVAAHPEQLSYFERAGMPLTPELLAAMEAHRETGEAVLMSPPGYDTPEALAEASPFHRWLLTEGRSAYASFLLTHPGVIVGAFGHLEESLLDPDAVRYASAASPWDGDPAASVVYPRQAAVAVVMTVLALALVAFVGLRFGGRRGWWVPGFLLAFSLPFAVFIYHSRGLEPDRHALVPSVLLRLGALVLILFAVDRWLVSRSNLPGRPTDQAGAGNGRAGHDDPDRLGHGREPGHARRS